jgi:hypothetical protein
MYIYMKTLQDHKQEFLKQASEFDTGKKDEDFHAYLRHHNLTHHLSETQIADRNRQNNYLNGVGLTLGVGIPLTLGAVFGVQKLTSNIMGHAGFRHLLGEGSKIGEGMDAGRKLKYGSTSLSGFNTRPMPTADGPVYYDQQAGGGFAPKYFIPNKNRNVIEETDFPNVPTHTQLPVGSSRDEVEVLPQISRSVGGDIFNQLTGMFGGFGYPNVPQSAHIEYNPFLQPERFSRDFQGDYVL